MKAKLMSYNQIDFQSKFHLEAEIKRIENNVKQMKHQFAKAGLLSFTVTQIWNKQELAPQSEQKSNLFRTIVKKRLM